MTPQAFEQLQVCICVSTRDFACSAREFARAPESVCVHVWERVCVRICVCERMYRYACVFARESLHACVFSRELVYACLLAREFEYSCVFACESTGMRVCLDERVGECLYACVLAGGRVCVRVCVCAIVCACVRACALVRASVWACGRVSRRCVALLIYPSHPHEYTLKPNVEQHTRCMCPLLLLSKP